MAFFRKKKQGQVILTQPISIHWDVEDPFTFVSHHEDDYPKGNAQQAPPLSEIGGRNLGRDYEKRMGFRMYHGKVVPGFPAHAHWGYETVTVADRGYIDHFDSKGNQGRYGFGDVQWLTAGGEYHHCEMYPLASSEERNPNDITQIMINLPLERKNTEPVFKMMWSEEIPIVQSDGYTVNVLAGSFGGKNAISPNELSWAADPEHHVSILKITAEPGAEITLPAISDTMGRNIYMINGSKVSFGEFEFQSGSRFKVPGGEDVTFVNGSEKAVFWVLEGEPISEKQTSFGPIILKNDKEVRDALAEIRKNEYSRWPWDVVDKAQPKGTGRFVRYADGKEECPSEHS